MFDVNFVYFLFGSCFFVRIMSLDIKYLFFEVGFCNNVFVFGVKFCF